MMTRKELAQIRRRFTPEKNDISIIRGCFVNENREIVSAFSKSPLSLPTSEAEHYLSVFKKTLGGAAGRNQFSIAVDYNAPSGQLLRRLQSSALQDERAAQDFFRTIIEGLEFEGSYLILAAFDTFSIPKKNSSVHTDAPDFSDNIFSYMIVSICPVKLTKPLLTFFSSDRDFHTVEPDLAVASPELGFMYPEFSDGGADVSAAHYYTKNYEDIHADFIDAVFTAAAPDSVADTRQAFQDVLADSLDEKLTYEVVQTIHDNLVGQLTERKKDEGPLEVSRREISSLLESCSVPKEKLAAFEKGYNETFGKGTGLAADTVIEAKKFEIEAGEAVKISVNPERSDLVEMKRIDNRRAVIIYVEGDVTVNGVEVNI